MRTQRTRVRVCARKGCGAAFQFGVLVWRIRTTWGLCGSEEPSLLLAGSLQGMWKQILLP